MEPRTTVFHVQKMKNAETTAKLEFFTSLAWKFYLNAFDANDESTHKIELSLNRDMTVMLLASKVRNKDLQKPTFSSRKNIVVVLATSYRCVCPGAADVLRQDPELLLRVQKVYLRKMLMKGLMSYFCGWQYLTVLLPCRLFLLQDVD